MSGRVLVVGSVNVDLVATVARLPAAGETVTDAAFAQHPGGKGANQATAAARLGAEVAFVGAVGDDPLAEDARASLALEGIDVTELAVVPGPTGVALIVVDATGENLIAVASGANFRLTAEAAGAALARLAPRPGDVVVVGCEIPSATARAALEIGRARGARTVLNPAPATGVDAAMLAVTDILVPNRIELAQLLGVTAVPDADVRDPARRLLAADGAPGVAVAIVTTLGAAGASLVGRDGAVVDVGSPRVVAVDTVGAGDAFVGALAADLAGGRDLAASARHAVAAASLSTTRPGARAGMPTRAELEAFLARILDRLLGRSADRTVARRTFGLRRVPEAWRTLLARALHRCPLYRAGTGDSIQMTVNAARRPRRRAAPPVPEPIVVPAESIAIGEINQTVFDCPTCARPLAMGARRCPACGTRLIIGVPMSKASVLLGGGLAVGLVVGATAGIVFGSVGRPIAVTPAPIVVPTAAPIGSLSGGTLATSVPIPSAPAGGGSTGGGMPALSRTALAQAVTVNDHLGASSAALKSALAAPAFDPSDVAQILRTISAESVYGERLGQGVASWPGSATVGARLTGLYGTIHDTAAEGLLASVRNEAAYRHAAQTMISLLAGLRDVDDELRDLAAANGVTVPDRAPTP